MTTFPTADVKAFQVYVEREGRTWSATSSQAPGWLAIASKKVGKNGIAEMAWQSLRFYVDDPSVCIVATYHWPAKDAGA